MCKENILKLVSCISEALYIHIQSLNFVRGKGRIGNMEEPDRPQMTM